MDKKYYAHTLEGKPPSDWQPLEKHLKNVAKMSRLFANAFDAGDWGYLAGLWHDIGKYSDEFQQMLGAEKGSDAHIETTTLTHRGMKIGRNWGHILLQTPGANLGTRMVEQTQEYCNLLDSIYEIRTVIENSRDL